MKERERDETAAEIARESARIAVPERYVSRMVARILGGPENRSLPPFALFPERKEPLRLILREDNEMI